MRFTGWSPLPYPSTIHKSFLIKKKTSFTNRQFLVGSSKNNLVFSSLTNCNHTDRKMVWGSDCAILNKLGIFPYFIRKDHSDFSDIPHGPKTSLTSSRVWYILANHASVWMNCRIHLYIDSNGKWKRVFQCYFTFELFLKSKINTLQGKINIGKCLKVFRIWFTFALALITGIPLIA